MKLKAISLGFVLTFALTAQSLPASAATLTIMRFAPSVTTTLDQGTITLTPPPSNSPARFRVEVANPAIARADGLVLTLLAVGNTAITYIQDAVPGFTADSRPSRIYIRPGVPRLGVWAERSVAMSANTFTLTPPTSQSNGSWSYSSSNPEVLTIAGNVATIIDGGEATVTATQFATSSWLGARTSTRITITAQTPVVSTIPNISLSVNGVSSFELRNPTSTSTGPWLYTSSNPGVVSVSGNRFVAVAPGSVTVTARQGRMGAFRSFTTTFKVDVVAVNPTITNSGFVATTVNLTGASSDFSLFTPLSESPGVWELTSSDPTVVRVNSISSINQIALTALKVGVITLTARQRASGTFAESAPVSVTVTVRGAPTVVKLPDIERVAGDPALTLVAPQSASNGAWSFISSNPAVATVNGNILTFTGAGSAVITATQAATALWAAASSSFEVRVGGVTPTLGAANPLSVDVGKSLDPAGLPTSNSPGKWIFTSENSAVARVVNGSVVGVAVGSTKISLYQEPAGRYGRSNMLTFTLTVTAASGGTPAAPPAPTTPPAAGAQPGVTNPAVPRAVAGASLSGRTLTVIVRNAREADIKVTINNVKAKLGVNTVARGARTVVVKHLDRVIYTRKFQVR